MIKTQPQTVQNVATASVANEPDNEMLLQRLEQLENELKTLKRTRNQTNKVNKQPKKPTRTIQRSKMRFYATRSESIRQSKQR